MTSLIVMGLNRMFRSLVFKIGVGVMVLYPLFIVLVSLKDRTPDSAPLNGVYNSGLVFIGLLIGAFVSVLIGQDYIEKTINNKIMAGHSRAAIYLSDFIVLSHTEFIAQPAACFQRPFPQRRELPVKAEPVLSAVESHCRLVCDLGLQVSHFLCRQIRRIAHNDVESAQLFGGILREHIAFDEVYICAVQRDILPQIRQRLL